MSPRARLVAFVVVCAFCVLAGTLAVVHLGAGGPVGVDAGAAEPGAGPEPEAVALAARPHVLFVETRRGPRHGHVLVADVAAPDGPAHDTGLRCERVSAGPRGGICLTAERGAITSYRAVLFDERFAVTSTRDLPGLPSRTRVSPGGTRGAMTTFVSGDSYAATSFSTRTEVLDLATGASLGDLEQFRVTRDGEVVDAVDRNFWGVTFADESRFYATMASGGEHDLIEGDLDRREATVRYRGLECPSLSPDGTRVAFKQRVEGDLGRVTWQLAVLDLATMAAHPVAEARSVDDQAMWLDDGTLLYALPQADSGTPAQDTWAVPADGSGAPRRFVEGARSLVVAR